MKNLRIVFMGTPEFAVTSLKALFKAKYSIVGVITAPDKPKGRGKKLTASAVKIFALGHHLPILQPKNLKAEKFLAELKSLKADLHIVVAFRMLPKAVWSMPPLGTFNLHGSLLPQYRGAAPINWAIINGETETGVTTFFLQQKIDTGDIIIQQKEPILPTDTVGNLYERLMHLGSKAVIDTVKMIESGKVTTQIQNNTENLNPAPKLFKETCKINWNQTAQRVHNFIRGLSPYPAAWSILNKLNFKIYKTKLLHESLSPSTIKSDNKTYIKVGCKTGALLLKELQLQGKRKMSVEDFLRGNNIV